MKKETSCMNSMAIIDYMKKYNEGDCSVLFGNLDPEIDSLPDPEAFLRDRNNWISCAVLSRLWERIRLFFDDERIAIKVARFAAENAHLGYNRSIIVKTFWSAKRALRHAQKINDKWNRSKRIELVSLRGHDAVIRLHWDSSMVLTKDACLMNLGTYRFIPLVWGGKEADVREECCYFQGAPYCEYHLKWPMGNTVREVFSRFFTKKSVLMETIEEMDKDKKIIEQKYDEVNSLNIELDSKINQLLALQETGKALVSVLDLEQLLDVIVNILSNVCNISRCIIMLLNEEEKHLEFPSGRLPARKYQ